LYRRTKELIKRTSPEQISKIIAEEHMESICFSSIYRHIDADRLKNGKLYKHLRRRGKKKRNSANDYKKTTTKDSNKISIDIKPKRSYLIMFGNAGHWEIDTIYGKNQKSFLLTLVDIASMYTIIAKLPNKEAKTVEEALDKIIKSTGIPIKSITSDNGGEFANHKKISQRYGFIWYFCHPYCSGERGLNENTNGLIRDFLPKGIDFNLHPATEIQEIQNNLNNRPRKRLGFVRPAHMFVNLMMNARPTEIGPHAIRDPVQVSILN
jgi:IS30 family transposase